MASKVQKMIFPNMDENPLENMTGTGNYFHGVERVGIDSVVDPITTGYAFIKWMHVPSWFNQNEDLKYFASLTEHTFKAFNGLNDTELQTAQRQTGFGGRTIDSVTGISNQNTDFSMDFDEYSGSPYRKMISIWINMIRDENTDTCRYPEIYGVEPGARNHTADLLYIMVRPDVDNIGNENRIEFAAYYQNVFPINDPVSSLYNYQLGSHENPRITIQFKGFCTKGPAVERMALRVLDDQIVTRASDADGHIFLDVFGSNDEVVENIKTGSVGEILSYSKNSD